MDVFAVVASIVAFLGLLGPTASATTCSSFPVRDVNFGYGTRTGIASSRGDVWISGDYAPASAPGINYPYVEHMDRTLHWTRIVLSQYPYAAFTSIASLGDGRIVAVGWENNGGVPLAVVFGPRGATQILGSPNELSVAGSLQSVTGVPGTSQLYSVLAFGATNLLRYDGSAWTAVRDAMPRGSALAVSASSANDVWVAGGRYDSLGILHGYVERFDGARWSVDAKDFQLELASSITAVGPNDVWVTGFRQEAGGSNPFVAHWNGVRWHQLPTPMERSMFTTFGNVVVDGNHDVWMGSYGPIPGTGTVSAVWHWGGASWNLAGNSTDWTTVPTIAPGYHSVWFFGGRLRHATDGYSWIGAAGCAG